MKDEICLPEQYSENDCIHPIEIKTNFFNDKNLMDKLLNGIQEAQYAVQNYQLLYTNYEKKCEENETHITAIITFMNFIKKEHPEFKDFDYQKLKDLCGKEESK